MEAKFCFVVQDKNGRIMGVFESMDMIDRSVFADIEVTPAMFHVKVDETDKESKRMRPDHPVPETRHAPPPRNNHRDLMYDLLTQG